MAASQANMLAGLGKLTELKQRILFVIGALIVYRLGSFIPVPGVNSDAMSKLIEGQGGIVDMFNMFSGGSLKRFSLFALGVVPYISASIIVQMFASVIPSLAGAAQGRRVRPAQADAVDTFRYRRIWRRSSRSASPRCCSSSPTWLFAPGPGFVFTAMIGLTAGTMFLMWLGEQITERGIGNGISLLIFAGIVAGLPSAIVRTLQMSQEGELSPLKVLTILLFVVGVTAFVVFVERGQRRITVNYARRQGGSRAYNNQTSHLPLKLNMSGVIPAIFASSLILFPATASQWFSKGSDIRWLQQVTAALSPGEPLYEILYAVLIIVFAFFYTALVFNSNETAENLKKSGALIPGIRPGRATADYIDSVLTRLTGAGALYLVAVCLVPTFLNQSWHVPFYFGGTSLLIVVVVVMDFTAQVQAHLVSHQYESLLKKANLKGMGRDGGRR